MTSNVNIVTDEKNDVLMVANRAIRNVGRQKMATVLFEGREIQAPVVTGMSGDSQTEIVSGLKEGDVVVVGTTTTTQNRGFGGGRVDRAERSWFQGDEAEQRQVDSHRQQEMGEVENDRDR